MSRKKILFIIWSYSLGGGAEKILSSIVRFIHDEFDIDLLEVEHFDVSWEELPDEVNVLGPIYDHTKGGLLNKLACAAKRGLCFVSSDAFRAVTRKTSGYDCVIAFNYLVPASLVFPHETSILWNHGSIDDLKENPLWRKREERALESAHAIVAISKRTKQSIEDVYPGLNKDIELIYNGFDIEGILRKADLPSVPDISGMAVVWIGRLDENKDPIAALRIFSEVREYCPEANLYFIGQGELQGKVEEEVEARNLSGNVHLLGYQQNPYPLIRKAGCVLSTSRREGFPTVLIESLALGKPFVCSNVAGSSEISDDGKYGYVYEDERAAAKALCEFLVNPLTEIQSSEMRQHAESFSLDKQRDSIMRLIEAVSAQDS